jgi:hypothetical protein
MRDANKIGKQVKFDEPHDEASRTLNLLLLALACALYVGARVWRLDAACLWFDEIFGVHAAVWHGWGGMWRFVALDLIHPPLFYAVLKVWAWAFGAGSVWWLRSLPVAVSVAWVVPFVLLARELGLRARVVNLALLLAAVSGTLIKYAQELRMYSLLLLCATCSLWLFARLCNRTTRARGNAVALFVVNLLLIYTHYFGWLVVALELAFVAAFARAQLKIFGASVVALAACFAPWAWAVWRAARACAGCLEQNLGWAARPSASEIFEPFLRLHEPFRAQQQSNEPAVLGVNVVLALVVFAAPLCASCWRVLVRRRADALSDHDDARIRAADERHMRDDATTRDDATGDRVGKRMREADERRVFASERRAVAFLIFFSFAPVVAAFVLAQILPQSVWGVRHLIVVAPAYLLLAAHALESLRPQWLALTLKILLGCWLALACVVALATKPAPPVWCAWETLAHEVARDEADERDECARSEADATRGETARRDCDATRGGATKIYVFEDLIAYQLWYALRSAGESHLRVAVVRNVSGVADDRAFFLPRGFDEVSVERLDAAMREGHFWLVFRDAGWNDEEHPALKLLRARGYEIERRFETSASGQRAYAISVRRQKENDEVGTMNDERKTTRL